MCFINAVKSSLKCILLLKEKGNPLFWIIIYFLVLKASIKVKQTVLQHPQCLRNFSRINANKIKQSLDNYHSFILHYNR